MEEMIPFLRMIAENPDDDAPRLVFADWLDEHDMPERAEFIRLQIELARMDPSDEGYPEKTARMRRCGIFTTKGVHPFFDHVPTEKVRIAFNRGFIETINTQNVERIDSSGFDLIPLQCLHLFGNRQDSFTRFTQLKKLNYTNWGWNELSTEHLLQLFGPKGCFKNLEQLAIRQLREDPVAEGAIPQFDLPKLREFLVWSPSFTSLGVPIVNTEDDEDEEFYDTPPWNGLAEYMPTNLIPINCPLERYIWHCDDDSDEYGDTDWEWRGPSMAQLTASLNRPSLREVELSVYWDDHESGGEGINVAPYELAPLQRFPHVNRISLHPQDLHLLQAVPKGQLKKLRLWSKDGGEIENIVRGLQYSACSDLEWLYIETRDYEALENRLRPTIFSELKHLEVFGIFSIFADCDMPKLQSLRGSIYWDEIQDRNCPNLQHLSLAIVSGNNHFEEFVLSDNFPNLTTLAITVTDELRKTLDLDLLAKCPHMPHLSLIRMSFPECYIAQEGQLVRCREDIIPLEEDMFDEIFNDRMY